MIRSGGICANFIYSYLTSSARSVSKNGGDELVESGHRLMCLSDTLASYGGVLSKISQLLSLENENTKVFSECKPYSMKETIAYLKNKYETDPEFFRNITELDWNVFKSGSVGQVHKCKYKGRDAIIKVQYVGLKKQFDSDICILDLVTSYLFYFSDLSHALTEIKTKLYEELDYKTEYKNQQTVFDLWIDHEFIHVPSLIPEVSNETLLGMELVNGVSFNEFITNSTQDERNHIGKLLIEFVFTNIYKHTLFYTDIHYGNFIISDNKHLHVTDFGSMNYMSENLVSILKRIHISLVNHDQDAFYKSVGDMGIMSEDISDDSKEYMYEYFQLQYAPWTQDSFEFTEEWLMKSVYKKTELMKDWILPAECVYLNKIPYGMYHLLTKLNLKGSFNTFINDLVER